MKPRLLTLLALLGPLVSRAAPFQNGSFESPRPAAPNPNNNYITTFAFNPVGSEATGWTFSGNVGVYTGRGSFQNFGPVDGYQQVNFNGGNTTPNGIIRQTFDTVTITDYVVGFWVGRVSSGAGTVGLAVKALSTTGAIIKQLNATPAAGAGYTFYQFTFRPVGTSTILSIEDISSAPATDVDVVLDAVSVAQVTQAAALTVAPSPATPTVVGNVGALYRIDVADALATGSDGATNWRILTYVTLPTTPFQFLDPDATAKASRFYRMTALTTSP